MGANIYPQAKKASIFGILSIALPIPAFCILSIFLSVVLPIRSDEVYIPILISAAIATTIGLVFGILSKINVNKGLKAYDELQKECSEYTTDEKELDKKFADKYFNGNLNLTEAYFNKIGTGYVFSRYGIVLNCVFLFIPCLILVLVLLH